jgi:amidase
MLRDLARDLRREGAKVSTSARPAFDPASAFELYMKLLSGALMGRASPEDIQRVVARAKHYAPDDRSANAIADRTVPMVHGTWLALNEQRHKIIRSWSAFFQDWDVLLCPVLAVPALPHNQQPADIPRRISIGGQETTWDNMLFWPGITGAFHLPASTAPLGRTRDGLPVGVQIVGPLYGDRTTLAVARLLEKSWMGFDAPPGWE